VNPRALVPLLLATVWLLSACASAPPLSATQELDQWFDQELAPYLEQQLTENPRFRGEPVMLVALTGAETDPQPDGLNAELRRRLRDRLLTRPGVHLVWRAEAAPLQHHRRLTSAECQERSEPHYLIGLESQPQSNGELRLSLRAQDLSDQTWVAGFGLAWQGRPDVRERALLGQRQSEQYLRGLRSLPFERGQADLAAQYLAQNLSCLLRERGIEQPVIHARPLDQGVPWLDTTFDLIGNYLGRYPEVRVSEDPARASLILEGEVHPIQGDLFQLWAQLREPASGSHLAGADTAAYVRLPQAVAAATPEPTTALAEATYEPPRRWSEAAPELSPLRLRPASSHACDGRLGADGCFGLELELPAASRIFLLQRMASGGLVRLFPAACGPPLRERILASGRRRLSFPPGLVALGEGWEGPGVATFYALAAADTRGAERLRRHLKRVPDRCGPGPEPGLQEPALGPWLEGLDALVAEPDNRIGWKARRVRHKAAPSYSKR
jgi:hypothetical protein